MGYAIFNAVAHLAMLILVVEILVLLVVPALGLGLAGVIGMRVARRRLTGPVTRARALPNCTAALVDRACSAAAWPVIQASSLWRGLRTALAVLRRS